MSKTKLPKDNKGRTILGTEYGITITRPWNEAMYKHNAKVSEQMKDAIQKALDKAYKAKDEKKVTIIARAINAYGYGPGMDIDDIYEDADRGLANTSDHWLDSDTWPDLIEAGLVKQLPQLLIGFKK
jgi:hypothetical protein